MWRENKTTLLLDVTGLSEPAIEDIRAHVRGKQEGPDYYNYELGSGWRCFHCGEMFWTQGGAELHFGKPSDPKPACAALPRQQQAAAPSVPAELEILVDRARRETRAMLAKIKGQAHADHWKTAEGMLLALAAVEPVGWQRSWRGGDWKECDDPEYWKKNDWSVRLIYTLPSAAADSGKAAK